MTARCPNDPTHDRFLANAVEIHEWLVTPTGDFVEDKGFIDVVDKPQTHNGWTCAICKIDAEFE